MSHRKLAIDGYDADREQLSQQMNYLNTKSTSEIASLVDQKASLARQAITRGSITEALQKALSEPPYGYGLEPAQAANALLVNEILLATRAQDQSSVIGSLGEDERDVLLKYIYHGLGRPAEFNCGVLLSWHEKIVEANGLGSIVRVMSDRKTL
ncbi:arp2/3 complex subunit [Coemansia sp. Benny D115]|nr:arp2/3 complex subunit [Coemansia sp. Benny D115]